ncbi:hypothetical protein PO124_20315 [Bacillus licheniformis]|nr:hypothetical protein [Bacillus licheniformis]
MLFSIPKSSEQKKKRLHLSTSLLTMKSQCPDQRRKRRTGLLQIAATVKSQLSEEEKRFRICRTGYGVRGRSGTA